MNARVIKRRIRSVGNTRKITRTMELVSTAKAKRAQDRLKAAQPYALALSKLAASASMAERALPSHPLCARREARRSVLVIVTANRGLCGGYNANVFRVGLEKRQALISEGQDVQLVMIGKKGIGYADFQKIPVASRIALFDERPSYQTAGRVLDPWLSAFASGKIDRLWVCYTHYASASRQLACVEPLLPFELAAKPEEEPEAPPKASVDFLWDPPPEVLLRSLVPVAVKTNFLRALMEANVSEQIARRIAMKNATENAGDLIRGLTRTYNRARQSQITQQIAEIVGGAEAIQ